MRYCTSTAKRSPEFGHGDYGERKDDHWSLDEARGNMLRWTWTCAAVGYGSVGISPTHQAV